MSEDDEITLDALSMKVSVRKGLKHVIEWSNTDQAQPHELLVVMTDTEGTQ